MLKNRKSSFHYSKVNKENFILTLLLLFKSSQASVLAFSPITTIIFLIYTFYVFKKRNLKVDKLFKNFSVVYLIISFSYLLSFGWIDIQLTIYIYIKLLYAYLSIKIIGSSFFENFQKIVFYGALISIPMFLMQILFYDLTFKLVGLIQNTIPFLEFRNDRFANIFVFTIEGYGAIFRNSGFMWEPKGYANILIFAILINLIQNKLNFLNKRILIYFIALITTFSTTGYIIIFILIPLFIMVNKNIFTKISSSLFVLFILFFISQLDFMYEKIKYETTLINEYETLLHTKRDFDRESISLGRLGSLIVDYNDFIKRPIFGYGYQRSERTQNPWIKLVRVNGFSDVLATYGLVGSLFYFIYYRKFFSKLLTYYNLKGLNILFLITLVIYFASTLTAHPIWMSFLFIHLIIPKNKNENFNNSLSKPK